MTGKQHSVSLGLILECIANGELAVGGRVARLRDIHPTVLGVPWDRIISAASSVMLDEDGKRPADVSVPSVAPCEYCGAPGDAPYICCPRSERA